MPIPIRSRTRLPHHGRDGAPRSALDVDAGPSPAGAVRDDHGLLRLRTAGALCRSQSDPGHAFHTMDGTAPHGAPSTLMPDRHLLELFVTITDFYGYGRQVPYAD